MRKLTFLTGLATGYVLGTKAGRERFDQLRGLVDQFLGKPQVQDTIATVKHETDTLVGKAKGTVAETVGGTETTSRGNGSAATSPASTRSTAASGTSPTTTAGAGTGAGTGTGTTKQSTKADPYPTRV